MSTSVQAYTDHSVEHKQCRICKSDKLTEVVNIGDQYVSTFPSPNQDFTKLPKTPIILDLCPKCGLTQQRYSVRNDLLYSRKYWYKSGTTDTMVSELRNITDDAIETLKIVNKTDIPLHVASIVLDIGSNDGTLLRQYQTTGILRVGVEPATNLARVGSKGVDLFINDFWNAEKYYTNVNKYLEMLGLPVKETFNRAKIVTAIGMLYDLEDPVKFIKDVSEVLDRDGIFIAQLMCVKQTLERADVGNLVHEHLEFYPLTTLYHMFMQCGLEIFRIESNNTNGGSYRIYAKHTNHVKGKLTTVEKQWIKNTDELLKQEMKFHYTAPFDQFNSIIQKNRSDLLNLLATEQAKKCKILGYGASTKANAILQYYGITKKQIPFIADKDKSKVGRTTVTGIPIISEEEAREKADHFVVFPYAFLDEFIERERNEKWRRSGGKFIVPLPNVFLI